MTQSLCPQCLALVPAKIIEKNGRVYFRKTCPTHGVREDFICSDVKQYDRMEFSLPGKVPAQFGIEPERGCPYDCGLCTEHEQHTCLIRLCMIAYLAYRFATEFIRPEPKLWLDLSIYQWAALTFIPVFAWLWLRDGQAMAAKVRIAEAV